MYNGHLICMLEGKQKFTIQKSEESILVLATACIRHGYVEKPGILGIDEQISGAGVYSEWGEIAGHESAEVI